MGVKVSPGEGGSHGVVCAIITASDRAVFVEETAGSNVVHITLHF